jgi:NADPH:quinone reductase-like Zn-dependent oxidoreductase
MVAFGTAWHGLLNAGRLTAGETVLINSVGSGVASAALQVVVLAGGRAIVTASADDKLEVAKADGAMAGINYRKENVRERVLELTDGRGVDLVFDVVGGDSFLTGLGLLSPGKRLVCIGAHGGEHVDLNLIDVFRDHVSIIGSHTQTRAELEKVLAEVAAGRLSPRVARTYPLEAVADAHSLLESRTAYGKIVLQNE